VHDNIPFIAAAECKTGMLVLTSTPVTICASRSVHDPESTSGKRNPLKKADGLYNLDTS